MIKATLYKKISSGKIQQWEIELDAKNGRFRTIEGIVAGKQTTSQWTVCEPKNVGKANERSASAQSEFEVNSKIQKKLDEGYVDKVLAVDAASEGFSPMLAHEFKKHAKKVKYPLYEQPKLDGIRCYIKADGMFGRNGKPIVAAPHIKELIDRLTDGVFREIPGIVFDGELYNHDLKDDFNKIVSLVKKTKPTEEDLEESRDIIQFYCFDLFIIGAPSMKFSDRNAYLNGILGNLHQSLVMVPTVSINSEDELNDRYALHLESGFEGQMVRLNDSPYHKGRTSNLLKRKEFIDEEFEITDILEGKGNRSGMAGKIALKLKSGEICKSGIRGKDEYFRELLKNKASYIGKKATCRFQNYTPDGSLRFPVVVAIRDYE